MVLDTRRYRHPSTASCILRIRQPNRTSLYRSMCIFVLYRMRGKIAMTCEDIYFEALTTMEIFYDNEIAALISYATDMGMNKTEYCGIPTLYPVIQQYFFRQFIDKIITGEMKIDFFQKPHKKR